MAVLRSTRRPTGSAPLVRHELGAGVWAWIHPGGGLGETNLGLVAGDQRAAVVDTPWDARLARAVAAEARALSPVPVDVVVNTHGDADHTWGNQHHPDADVVATAATAAHFDEDDPRLLRLAGHAGRLLRPVAGEMVATLARTDLRGVRPTPPTHTFTGHHDLELGGRTLHLVQHGPAHAEGDLTVHVADADVVFAGDLVMLGGFWPVTWAGPVERWVRALDAIVAMAPRVVVPGHGPLTDVTGVTAMRDLLAWIDETAQRELARGRSVARVTRLLADHPSPPAGPWGRLRALEPLHITVSTIDRHRRGLGPRGTVDRLRTVLGANVQARLPAIAPTPRVQEHR